MFNYLSSKQVSVSALMSGLKSSLVSSFSGQCQAASPRPLFYYHKQTRRLPLFCTQWAFKSASFHSFCARNKTKPSNKAQADTLFCLALDEQHIHWPLSLRDTLKPSLRPFGCLSWPGLTRPSHSYEPTHSIRQHHLTQSSVMGHATPSGRSPLCVAQWRNGAEMIRRHWCLEMDWWWRFTSYMNNLNN